MDTCAFCDILAGKRPVSIVHKDDLCCAFMDIQPINPGHVLIVPTRHASTLAELDEETGAHIFRIAQRVAKALRSGDLTCEGVNLFLADGSAAGQTIFHVHLHVFPRNRGDGFGLMFGPKYGNRPPKEVLEAIADMIRDTLCR